MKPGRVVFGIATAMAVAVALQQAVGRTASDGGAVERRRGEEPLPSPAQAPTLVWFPDGGIVRVPFQRSRSHVLVQASSIGGARHTLVLDTGANVSVVTPAFQKATPVRELASARSDSAAGTHGTLPNVPRFVELRDLRIGSLEIERASAAEMQLPALDQELGVEVHGMIGFNVLSRMVTVIDYAGREVMFIDPTSDAEARTLGRPDHAIPFRLRMGALIELDGRVNGGDSVPFIYDIGSPYTFLNGPGARASGITFRRESDAAVVKGCGLVEGTQLETGLADSLHFGTLAFEPARIHALDLPVFAALGLGGGPAGLLGNDLLGARRVAIDYRAMELRVWDR